MNRIEMAAAKTDLQPLVVEGPTNPVSAAVAAFFAAAAIGYIVGYNLGATEVPENLPADLDGTVLGSASSSDLLAARTEMLTA